VRGWMTRPKPPANIGGGRTPGAKEILQGQVDDELFCSLCLIGGTKYQTKTG